MRKSFFLLAGLVLLYLVPALVLKAAYGESYSLWSGEDSWVPAADGSWIKQGEPSVPMPSEQSIDIPIGYRYIPIFLPAAMLILFLFTPLRRFLEDRTADEQPDDSDHAEIDESASDIADS